MSSAIPVVQDPNPSTAAEVAEDGLAAAAARKILRI